MKTLLILLSSFIVVFSLDRSKYSTTAVESFASFNSYIAAKGDTNVSFDVTKSFNVTVNTTVPITMDIHSFRNNSAITISGGVTLTINSFTADPNYIVFKGNGSHIVFAQCMPKVRSIWFGPGVTYSYNNCSDTTFVNRLNASTINSGSMSSTNINITNNVNTANVNATGNLMGKYVASEKGSIDTIITDSINSSKVETDLLKIGSTIITNFVTSCINACASTYATIQNVFSQLTSGQIPYFNGTRFVKSPLTVSGDSVTWDSIGILSSTYNYFGIHGVTTVPYLRSANSTGLALENPIVYSGVNQSDVDVDTSSVLSFGDYQYNSWTIGTIKDPEWHEPSFIMFGRGTIFFKYADGRGANFYSTLSVLGHKVWDDSILPFEYINGTLTYPNKAILGGDGNNGGWALGPAIGYDHYNSLLQGINNSLILATTIKTDTGKIKNIYIDDTYLPGRVDRTVYQSAREREQQPNVDMPILYGKDSIFIPANFFNENRSIRISAEVNGYHSNPMSWGSRNTSGTYNTWSYDNGIMNIDQTGIGHIDIEIYSPVGSGKLYVMPRYSMSTTAGSLTWYNDYNVALNGYIKLFLSYSSNIGPTLYRASMQIIEGN